jgi:hypothetical protein
MKTSTSIAACIALLASFGAAIDIAVSPDASQSCPTQCRPAWTQGLPDADVITPSFFDAASDFPVFKGTVGNGNVSAFGTHITPGYVYSAYDQHSNIIGFVAVCPATRWASDSPSLPQPQTQGTHPDRVTQTSCTPGPMSLLDEPGTVEGPTLASGLLAGFASAAAGPVGVDQGTNARTRYTFYFSYDGQERPDGMRYSGQGYYSTNNVVNGRFATSYREWSLYNPADGPAEAVLIITDANGELSAFSVGLSFTYLGTPAWKFGDEFNTTAYPDIPGPSGIVPDVCAISNDVVPYQAGNRACSP